MLLHLRVVPHEEHAPLGDVRHGRPDLLAVDDPLITVGHRARGQCGHIGSRPRFGEHLAPDLLPRVQRPEPLLLLLPRAVGEQHRCAHADAKDVVDRRIRRAFRPQPRVDDWLQRRRHPEASKAFGEPHESKPQIETSAQELGVRAVEVVLGEQRLESRLDELTFGGDGHAGLQDRAYRVIRRRDPRSRPRLHGVPTGGRH